MGLLIVIVRYIQPEIIAHGLVNGVEPCVGLPIHLSQNCCVMYSPLDPSNSINTYLTSRHYHLVFFLHIPVLIYRNIRDGVVG